MRLVSGNVHYYRPFMTEKNRYALKLELCYLSHVLAESFNLKYKDVSILGTNYRRMDWSCGSISLAYIFTSAALLCVVFVYCLRKRLFLSCPPHRPCFPAVVRAGVHGSCGLPGTVQAPQDTGGEHGAHRPPRLPQAWARCQARGAQFK